MEGGGEMAFVWRTAAFESIFEDGRLPRVLSVGMEDFNARKTVRAMHQHDDRLEFLLIKTGSGVHTIDGQAYHAATGDVLITRLAVRRRMSGNRPRPSAEAVMS